MKNVRTRYAPSPTGYLHIGGARTALFSYLFAKHNGGKFIVRIEDTDIKRNIKDAGKKQLENLIWLGITPDESPLNTNPKYRPYSQMKKVKRYLEIAKALIDSKKAYIAFENFEELEKQKLEQKKRGIKSFRYDRHWLKISDEEKKRRLKNNEYSIRLSLPKNKNYSWDDLVRGKMQFNSDDVGDFIIIKTNKLPTYNFAVVVDDHDMAISHVLRGEEHISNTPKQLAIYEALKWKAPEFGHLTIITNLEGKKISKRDKDIKQFISQYRNEGVLPEAIFLYLAFLGWTHPQAKEIISKEELIKAFDYKRLSKSPSKFDTKKMLWFSSVMIKKMKNEEIEKLLEIPRDKKWINFFIETYKDSVSTLNDFYAHFELYKNESVKKITVDNVVSVFKNILEKLPFTYLNIKKAIELTKKKTNCAGKKLFLPLRKAITYESEGPELARAIFLLGEDLVKRRLNF